MYIGLFDDDVGGYDEVAFTSHTANTKISIDYGGETGNCFSVPFKHTFRDVDIASFADGLDNNVELYAACADYRSSLVTGPDDIDEFGDILGGSFEGFYSSEVEVTIRGNRPNETT